MVGASDGPRQHGDVLWVGGADSSWELAWREERLMAYHMDCATQNYWIG